VIEAGAMIGEVGPVAVTVIVTVLLSIEMEVTGIIHPTRDRITGTGTPMGTKVTKRVIFNKHTPQLFPA